MKEISDIIKAYETAKKNLKKAALATVVKVEGSSYRRPGARMLVTDDGELIGAVSGGCLEGDALKKALLAIHQQTNKLVTYDTSVEDESDFGVQLGCNGIVHILFEFIHFDNAENPVELLKKTAEKREDAVVLCLFSEDRMQKQPGTLVFYRNNLSKLSETFSEFKEELQSVLINKRTLVKDIIFKNEEFSALYDFIPAAVSLVIAGAGNDVKPLVEMAAIIGWEVHVTDGRHLHTTKERFPKADSVQIILSENFADNFQIDEQTFFVLMTHNYRYDLEVLKQLLDKNARYVGVLGPKTKLERMFDDLENLGCIVTDDLKKKIYGPVGLDIGAETSEEIALSVVAEIKAVLEGKNGRSLKFKTEKIHEDRN
jgi:xanthine/CO dehydrogenase XdhC/CoxF family maturation factor